MHFDFGDGQCPFGTSCFYRHAYRDGRLEVRLLCVPHSGYRWLVGWCAGEVKDSSGQPKKHAPGSALVCASCLRLLSLACLACVCVCAYICRRCSCGVLATQMATSR